MQRLSKRRGFTLIELLVVVVIIGILAAIGVGGYAAAMEKSRNSGVISNVRSILTGIEQWKSDHTGLPLELTGADHTVAICSNTDPPGGDFPTNYVPGGRLPVAPWSKRSQTSFETLFSNGDGVSPTRDAQMYAFVSEGATNFGEVQGRGGIIDDGGPADGKTPVNGAGPSLRAHYGYVYYVGDISSTRYGIFGIGKLAKFPGCVAYKTNYQ